MKRRSVGSNTKENKSEFTPRLSVPNSALKGKNKVRDSILQDVETHMNQFFKNSNITDPKAKSEIEYLQNRLEDEIIKSARI